MDLPVRGERVRELGVVLPPRRMARMRGTRPLKRWRYVGYYAPDLMLCVGDARIGPVPQRWWAVAGPDGTLRERTTIGRGGIDLGGSGVRVDTEDVRIDLQLDERDGVEIVSPAGQHYIWTRKQAGVPVKGVVEVAGTRHDVDGRAFVDDSAGYHPRHTAWQWSAGHGRTVDGREIAWNLVTGIHDSVKDSERTLWLDGEPHEVRPVQFAADLSSITFANGARLHFEEWSAREETTNMLLMRSDYRQPFGAFSGSLPGGLELAAGHGVMERHDVHW
jgi:hypothetical protein